MPTRIINLSDNSGVRVWWTRQVPYRATEDESRNGHIADRVGALNIETHHDFADSSDAEDFVAAIEAGSLDIAADQIGSLGQASDGYRNIQTSAREIVRD